MKTYIIKVILSLTFFSIISCGPKQGTMQDKQSVKGDTLDVREGSGEGTVGEGDMGTEDQDDSDDQ